MLCACGITSFWASRLGPGTGGIPLMGQLKVTPEDFIVVEVDVAGQRTDAEPYDFHKPTPLKTSSATDEVAESDNVGDADAEAVCAALPIDNDGIVNEKQSDLDKSEKKDGGDDAFPMSGKLSRMLYQLDAQLRESGFTRETIVCRSQGLTPPELRCLVVDTIRTSVGAPGNRNTAPAENTAGEPRPWWEKTFWLSQQLNKEQRRLLHFAVRNRYGHLRTIGPSGFSTAAAAARSDGAEDVLAGVDPLFVFFTFTFGESVAGVLAQWSQQRSVVAAAAKMSREDVDILQRLGTEVQQQHGDDREGGDGTTERQWGPRAAAPPTTLHTSFPPAAKIQGDDSDGDALTKTLSEKDFRRAFHEIMRRFFSFVRCSVRDGRITLSYTPTATKEAHTGGGASNGKKQGRARQQDSEAPEAKVHKAHAGVSAPLATSGSYVYCIVKKTNLDTMEMKALLAEAFKVNQGVVCMAGMKDKRAITYQRVSFPCNAAYATFSRADSSQQNGSRIVWPSDPHSSYLEVLSTCSGEMLQKPIQLGELSGNHFSITVRSIARQQQQQQQQQQGQKQSLPNCSGEAQAQSTVAGDLQTQFALVAQYGFVNYFGQQRFSESVSDLQDHTGLHLFCSRYVAAVRSLYRACPEVYDGFPDTMDVKHVPRNSRDCVAMTHSLRQTYRMYFSEYPLTVADVKEESALWARLCEKAICESVPFALRSLWVHAGQSLFFNVAASYAADTLTSAYRQGSRSLEETKRLASQLFLPLAGYRVKKDGRIAQKDSDIEAVDSIVSEAELHALSTLQLPRAAVFETRRVAGIPVPGSWRRVFIIPQETALTVSAAAANANASTDMVTATMSFFLPSSSYATICLREVFCTDQWW